MFDDVPGHLIFMFMLLLLLAGPVVFFSFVIGGSMVGFIAIVAVVVTFVVLYILAGRNMSSK